ncbi:stage II sporulation protein Q [Paenibacillus catalpae]|uniref:Stage II sporulation protein Q n=1 Tax=Paenibacillus catalpae TaxID=1045775 RepID=A0A1I2H4H4_9BACL|nr:M23 family metallopeptidase [Paenibacillus catalpae]SFF24303.1 stage II sporulation protein Q [Paenibacillus catalpae]
MNENQNKPKQESPKNVLGEVSAAKSSNGFKRLLSRKWVTPAAFMVAAAIIVALMWIYQGSDDTKETSATTSEQTETAVGNEAVKPDDQALEESRKGEMLEWPVASKDALDEVLPYYDANATVEENAKAVVQTNDNTFVAHTGVDLADPSDQPFDVLAALSGKVTRVEKHPTNGNVVEISHGNGLVTVYQSLSDIQVAVGDDVKQGTKIAVAGRNDLESDLGVHLHFSVKEDGKSVNPASLVGKSLSEEK